MTELLKVRNLTTHLFTDAGVVQAVEDVSLHIRPTEAVALVGESGCGKSTTALSLMRLIRLPGRILRGQVMLKDRNLLALSESQMRKVRGKEISMVFQDPMTYLNPLMRIGDQIAEAIRIHQGLSADQGWKKALEALHMVKIPSPERIILSYPHQLSGGMRQRVLIAIAISCHPYLLIADEPTTALDVTIQAQIMVLLSNVRKELESALLLITHDLGLVAEYCDRVYVMYAGHIVEEADVFSLFKSPKHPYTTALLKSCMSIDHRFDTFGSIEGQPPNLVVPPAGCRFHPRCSNVVDPCRQENPPMIPLGDDRLVRCWLYKDHKDGGTPSS